jgi:hypothetical protein
VYFVLKWPNEEFVSVIGYILLTKTLPCECAAETEMLYLSRVFQEYSELNSQLWKGLNMTSISVTSIKKAISRLLEDSAQFTT